MSLTRTCSILSLSLWHLCAGPGPSPKQIQALRVEQAPTIDGRLDEAVWDQAQAATDFLQEWPLHGRPASFPTRVKILYDDRFLYVGARWEFRPGSTAYLVYSHGCATDELINANGSLSPRRDLARLHQLPSHRILQLKVSWMFH